MGSGKLIEDKVLSGAAAVLGIKTADDLPVLDRRRLATYTQKQLFECAKRLQLKGVSKLSKDELASRVASEFAGRSGATVKSSVGSKPSPSAVEAVAPTEKDAATPGDGADSAWSHKFEMREQPKAEAPVTIPWSYDYDRVTGMAVDPDRLFVYWEVTDDSIDRARVALGKSGKESWLCLRIYDTTDRIFDGTNAHTYVDHRVERGDRHWFFQIGKPSSSAFVDVGMKSNEGYFAKITRSGRVEFPRREPAPWAEPEWLSVRSFAGPIEHAGRGSHIRRQGPPPAGPQGPAVEMPGQGPKRHVALLPWEESAIVAQGGHQEVIEWEEHMIDGTTEFHRETTWESPVMVSAWEAGPFSFPVSTPEPVREDFVGPSRVYRVGDRTHVVHGPWQVVIKGVGAHQGRAVVARWEIYRSWVSEEKAQLSGEPKEYSIAGSSEKLLGGASEMRWRYASEMRLGGASEIFFMGASEYKMRGASERMFMGASQYLMRGASERQFAGSSEVRMRGASERMLGGASELRMGGASEQMLGASEHRLGGSEERLVAESSPPADMGFYPTTESIGKEPEHKE